MLAQNGYREDHWRSKKPPKSQTFWGGGVKSRPSGRLERLFLIPGLATVCTQVTLFSWPPASASQVFGSFTNRGLKTSLITTLRRSSCARIAAESRVVTSYPQYVMYNCSIYLTIKKKFQRRKKHSLPMPILVCVCLTRMWLHIQLLNDVTQHNQQSPLGQRLPKLT